MTLGARGLIFSRNISVGSIVGGWSSISSKVIFFNGFESRRI